ncbi:hypothetical protein BH11PSE9_BH11PSE9_16350 [soil metagenome]
MPSASTTEFSGAAPRSSAAGQRRYLTVLFSDLADSTRLGEVMEAEHYAEMLSAWRALCREIIPRHGGRIARIQGDGVLAIFGYPQALEDDGRRATEAALELHAAVSRIAIDGSAAALGAPTLPSGIHAGLVYLADGDVERGRFELLGNVPNTAARLSERAGRGEICVSEETLGPQVSLFATGDRELAHLRGRTLPMAVYRVQGRAAAQSRFAARAVRGLAPFVGRETELRALREHLRLAIEGVPQCIALAGGPGLGKTRLIEEIVREAGLAQCLVLRGYCESYLAAEPLQPFLQMLRALFGLAHDMSAAEAAEAAEQTLAQVHVIGDTARADTLQALWLVAPAGDARRPSAGGTIAALRGAFEALASDRPLLLVIDDWQWADDASLQVLDAIRALARPICVLLATRGASGEGGEGASDEITSQRFAPSGFPTLELAPLTLAETTRSMERLLPGADPFTIAEIHRYAGGIPLFIEELCHSAAAEGTGRKPDLRLGGAAWLHALIESRVARLPQAQAEIVRAAAVIGNVFPSWLLERITGYGEDDPLVQSLAEQDFIYPGERPGTMRFKHGITRDVVYDAIGLHQRTAMHLRVAATLAAHGAQAGVEDAYEALAYHYAEGTLPTEAARYAELAGDKAMSAMALDRARAQYSAALAALDGLARMTRQTQLRWCAIAQKLGMACVFDPLGLADGVAIFERGVALARQSGDEDTIARAEYWLGYICYAKGMARQATRHCETSLEMSNRIGDARLATQVRATLGQVLLSACDYEHALVLFDEAIDGKRQQSKPGSSIAVGSAYTLACKGYLLGDRGLFAQAEECFDHALALLGGSVHQVASSVRHWISVVYQWQGRFEDALRVSEESARIAEGVKSRQQFAMGSALSGYSRWMLTREPQALQAIRDATTWIEARKGALATSLNYGWLIDGASREDHASEARRHAARLFMRARQHDRIGEALGCRALARMSAKAGDAARADHYLALARRSAEARGSAHEHAATELCRAEIELARGHRGPAGEALDAAAAAFESMRMAWHLAQSEVLRSQL